MITADHLTKAEKTAVAANLANILQWERSLGRGDNDPETHQLTADLLQQVQQLLLPEEPRPTTGASEQQAEQKRAKRGRPKGRKASTWIENRFVERNGKRYGPYRYEITETTDGKRKAKYLGKVKV